MTQEEMNTRDRIIDTAKCLFAEKGFYGVSVRDITGTAGVNTSMVSYYFGGKEGLYEAIFEMEFMPLLDFLARKDLLAGMDPRERIVFLAEKVVEMHTLHPELAKLLHHEIFTPTRMYSEKIISGITLLAGAFRSSFQEGIEKGQFRSDLETFEMSYALASMVNYQFIFSDLISSIMKNLEVPRIRTENLISILFEGINDPNAT
ncbi:MAG: TetR/AcrR family transcriptional regulator [Synergistales bacterium]|nr:TetR/AcrR family transcriptional regulator [Synergistales bacterium]